MKRIFQVAILIMALLSPVAASAQTKTIKVPKKEKTAKTTTSAAEQNRLGLDIFWNKGDEKKASEWFHKAAKQGYAPAQFNLGLLYDEFCLGDYLKHYDNAAYWYRKAAEQGDYYAQVSLGLLYEYGNGVAKDYKQAVYWFRKAAEQGCHLAQWHLSCCYKEGKGVDKDEKQAKYWSQKSEGKDNDDGKHIDYQKWLDL